MKKKEILAGFSKLSKKEKLEIVATYFENSSEYIEELKTFWHKDIKKQKLFEEFSENIISNYFLPYSVVPNFIIDGKIYFLPMVTEESSVVAAAANSAKFWSTKGGFHTQIISSTKIGQVHFNWKGDKAKLIRLMPQIKQQLIKNTRHITENMEKRGGGIIDIELVDMTSEMEDYYQLKASFETIDAMGANFINSCLENFANELKCFISKNSEFSAEEKNCEIIMSILSNYTPDCLVECYVECNIKEFESIDNNLNATEFVKKFKKAVEIAHIDTFRATTHNKGIYNGIDAVVLATGNDFRSIEACGHTYASRSGLYKSLTNVSIGNNRFRYTLKLPIAMGTVGGLTSLHPMAKRSLELLENPNARMLTRIASAAGLANNYGAVKSLITKGIQIGHMKMHLLNILNQMEATSNEKKRAVEHFRDNIVSHSSVEKFLREFREINPQS